MSMTSVDLFSVPHCKRKLFPSSSWQLFLALFIRGGGVDGSVIRPHSSVGPVPNHKWLRATYPCLYPWNPESSCLEEVKIDSEPHQSSGSSISPQQKSFSHNTRHCRLQFIFRLLAHNLCRTSQVLQVSHTRNLL